MSAAEKLRALNEAEALEKYEIDLFRVLPQIVAVVEAAERERSPHHADYWTSDQQCPLCNALSALDGALT